ncbi:MAG: glycosyltransferase [Planctomycetes bacterium]|nr:glycosyltransferase [Planctomycetota bacterium]
MRWLFVTAAFPWPLDHGTYLRVYHLARTLAAGGDDVALLAPGDDPDGRRAYAQAGVRVLDGPAAGPPPGAYRGAHPPDEALARAVARRAGDADVAVLVHARTLQHAPAARPARVVADLVDDLVVEEGRKLWRDLRPPAWARRAQFLARQRACERRLVPSIDLATFVSDVDARAFARRHRGAAVGVVPNGVDAAHFAPPGPPGSVSPTVVFVGRLAHPPNADAARWLLGPVASHLRRLEPAARIVIVGGDAPPDLQALAGPGDRITGRVEDVRPWLWDAAAVALPMRIGTGVKNKLLEAWAAGKAVVATPLACQGVPAAPGENLLVAEGPSALAESIASLLRDPAMRDRLGRRGRQTVLDHLTWQAAGAALRRLAGA